MKKKNNIANVRIPYFGLLTNSLDIFEYPFNPFITEAVII